MQTCLLIFTFTCIHDVRCTMYNVRCACYVSKTMTYIYNRLIPFSHLRLYRVFFSLSFVILCISCEHQTNKRTNQRTNQRTKIMITAKRSEKKTSVSLCNHSFSYAIRLNAPKKNEEKKIMHAYFHRILVRYSFCEFYHVYMYSTCCF